MNRQGIAIRWIMILGIGAFLFLWGTAALMRRAGIQDAPPRPRPNASPFSADRALAMETRLRGKAPLEAAATLFGALREAGLRPRLRGTVDTPQGVWTITEGPADAPVIALAVTVNGDNAVAALIMAELAQSLPSRGLRHRIVTLWLPDTPSLSPPATLGTLLREEAWGARARIAFVLTAPSGQTFRLCRDRETPHAIWDTFIEASRRVGYAGVLRPIPTSVDFSAWREHVNVPVAGLEAMVPRSKEGSALSRDSIQSLGDLLYHAVVTLGYDLIVRAIAF